MHSEIRARLHEDRFLWKRSNIESVRPCVYSKPPFSLKLHRQKLHFLFFSKTLLSRLFQKNLPLCCLEMHSCLQWQIFSSFFYEDVSNCRSRLFLFLKPQQTSVTWAWWDTRSCPRASTCWTTTGMWWDPPKSLQDTWVASHAWLLNALTPAAEVFHL